MYIPVGWRQINIGNDSNAEKIAIEVPRYYGSERIDLSQYTMYLKTVSAGGRDDILLSPEVDENTLSAVWTLCPPQTSFCGPLILQIRFEGENFKWETAASRIEILPSADAPPAVPAAPSAYEEWLHNLQSVADSVLDLTVSAESLPGGADASVEKTVSSDVFNLHFKIPRGNTGQTGNGIAHIGKTSSSGNVDTYTITMTDGTTSTFTVTNGSVTSVDGMTGDVVLDIDSKSNIGRTAVICPPSGFSWQDNPLKGKIRNDYKGNVVVDYDVSEEAPVIAGGKTYWVATNGRDTNDGLTPETALASMSAALAKNDVACIMLKGGIYRATAGLRNTVITKSVSIKGAAGEDVFVTIHAPSTFEASSTYENVYVAVRGNCRGVIDLANKNRDGHYLRYPRVSSIAEVVSTEGSWTLADGNIYLHTVNNRVPDSNLILLANYANNIKAEGNITVYLENLKVYGGDTVIEMNNGASNNRIKFVAKDCEFAYTNDVTGSNVLTITGADSYMQNCSILYGLKDGANYAKGTGNVQTRMIEINCEGAYNGDGNGSDDQASTLHNGAYGIRINGLYHENYGSCIADNHEGTEAWNIGCVCYGAIGEGSQNCNYFAYDGVKEFLDSCVGFGSLYNVHARNEESVVALRNCRMEGTLAPESSINRIVYY